MIPEYVVTPTGRRMYVDPADPRAAELVRARGDLNPRSRLLWQRALDLRRWSRVVDIGVNYGEMLVGVSLPEGAEVVGFEPNPTIRPIVARTLEEAGLEVDLRAAAVSDRPGTARFAIDSTWSGTSALAAADDEPGRWRHVDVDVTTLDATLGADGRSFCAKVDVEGFEREVMAGAKESLAATEHWVLMLEVLHMDRAYLAELAATYPVFLAGLDDRPAVRVPADPEEISLLLASGTVYPQDCLVTSEALAAGSAV